MIAEINLLPWRRLRKKAQMKKAGWIYGVGMLSAIIVIIVVHQFYDQKNVILALRIQELHSQLIAKTQPSLHQVTNEDGLITHKIQYQANKLKVINNFFHIKTQGIYINEIDYKANSIVFAGVANSIKNIHGLMSAMLKVQGVRSIKLDSLKRDQNLIRFQLRTMDEE